MKSFYLLLTILSIAYAQDAVDETCGGFVDNGVLTWNVVTHSTGIPGYKFQNCAFIKSAELTGVTSIGTGAFQNAGHADGMDLNFPDLIRIDQQLAFREAKIKSFSAPNIVYIGNYVFYKVNQETDIVLDLNFPLLTRLGTGAFKLAKLNTLRVPTLSTITDNTFSSTTVSSYAVMKREFACDDRTSEFYLYHPEDTTFHLTLATQQQLKTEYHGRGLLTEDVSLYLPLATQQQLKTEYQSRGTCT